MYICIYIYVAYKKTGTPMATKDGLNSGILACISPGSSAGKACKNTQTPKPPNPKS